MTKKNLFGIIAALLLIIAGMGLNPSLDKHREAIRAAVAQHNPIAGAIGLGVLSSLIVDYHSMGLFSYTTSDDHVISVGALGIVHVIEHAKNDSSVMP